MCCQSLSNSFLPASLALAAVLVLLWAWFCQADEGLAHHHLAVFSLLALFYPGLSCQPSLWRFSLTA
jgi:hypothetical protein